MDLLVVDNLKVGDKVGVSGYGWNPIHSIKTVAKRTATQVVLDDGSRWNKHGHKIGEHSAWHRSYLMTVADAESRNAEETKRRARLALVREVKDFDWNDVDDEGLRLVLQAAKDHKF